MKKRDEILYDKKHEILCPSCRRAKLSKAFQSRLYYCLKCNKQFVLTIVSSSKKGEYLALMTSPTNEEEEENRRRIAMGEPTTQRLVVLVQKLQ